MSEPVPTSSSFISFSEEGTQIEYYIQQSLKGALHVLEAEMPASADTRQGGSAPESPIHTTNAGVSGSSARTSSNEPKDLEEVELSDSHIEGEVMERVVGRVDHSSSFKTESVHMDPALDFTHTNPMAEETGRTIPLDDMSGASLQETQPSFDSSNDDALNEYPVEEPSIRENSSILQPNAGGQMARTPDEEKKPSNEGASPNFQAPVTQHAAPATTDTYSDLRKGTYGSSFEDISELSSANTESCLDVQTGENKNVDAGLSELISNLSLSSGPKENEASIQPPRSTFSRIKSSIGCSIL